MEYGETVHEANGRWSHFDRAELSNGSGYSFMFRGQDNGSVIIEVPRKPDYGNQSTDPHKTHLLHEGDRNIVCCEPLPRTLADAKKVAAEWAKRTDRYVRSGVPIET